MTDAGVKRQFVICVDNDGYPASLERWKVYRALPDRKANAHGLLRVMDESGEDYLYEKARFRAIELPASVGRLFRGKSVAYSAYQFFSHLCPSSLETI